MRSIDSAGPLSLSRRMLLIRPFEEKSAGICALAQASIEHRIDERPVLKEFKRALEHQQELLTLVVTS
ncbi:MAG: hypothetical protein QM771_11455 [Nitrospira sp.]